MRGPREPKRLACMVMLDPASRSRQLVRTKREEDSMPPLDIDQRPSFWRQSTLEMSKTGEGVAMSDHREQFQRRVEELVARF